MRPILAALLLLSIGGCGQTTTKQRTAPNQPGALVIAYRPDSADTFVAVRSDSVVALDWLREIARSHDIALELNSYPYGTLIEQVGPRRNGDGGYWLYRVNGQMVPKSADAHPVAWSDTVTFFFDER
jgi:hypothetical protein